MKVWVLTREINEYDQDGAYYEGAFKEKPSIEELANFFSKNELEGVGGDIAGAVALMEHIRNGGGRRDKESTWYNLMEEELS